MRDVYIILRDRFESDYLYFSEEMNSINDKEYNLGLSEYDKCRLEQLKGKREYSKRQINFFDELINYYK